MKRKVMVLFLIISLVSAFAVFAGGQTELSSGQVETGKKAMNMATEIANAIKGRFGDMHEKIVRDGHRDSAEYEEFHTVLAAYVDKFKVTYIYTLIKINDEMTNLIVDAADDEYADDYGAEYEMEPQMVSAFGGTPDYAKDIWKDDDFGWQISGFAPLYNSQGKIVALIGVDTPVSSK